MIISTTNAPIQATIAAPSDRCRPAYAPSANTAAVSATSPIVWPNSVAVWSRVEYPGYAGLVYISHFLLNLGRLQNSRATQPIISNGPLAPANA